MPLARKPKRQMRRIELEWSADELLDRMQGPSTARLKTCGFQMTDTWHTVGHRLVRATSATNTESDLIFKIGHVGSRFFKPREQYAETVRLAGNPTLEAAGIRVAEPLGWGDDPPFYCARYIPGRDLLIHLQDIAAGEDPANMLPWIHRLGIGLAAYHAASRPPNDRAAAAHEEAQQDLQRVSRSLWARSRHTELGPEAVTVFHGDFTLRNLRVDPAEALWMIDPSYTGRHDFVHRDVAVTLLNLRQHSRALAPQLGSAMRERFLDGYSSAGPELRKQPHEHVLGLYESIVALKKTRIQYRRHRYRPAAMHLRWGLGHRARMIARRG